MKTLQPIYGQTYVGYYLNALTEECEISGVCKNYHGTPVIVNEKGEWVPFEKLTEDSYLTPPFVEPRLRESVRRFLREEIDKGKFLDKLESLSDDEQEDLMTSLLTAVEADAETGQDNDDIIADEVASEIESWVAGEDVSEEASPEVTEDVEESVVALLGESRLTEASFSQITQKLLKLVDSPTPQFFDFMKKTAASGWEALVRGIQTPTQDELVNLRGAMIRALKKAQAEAPNVVDTGLVPYTQKSLQNLANTLRLNITVADLQNVEEVLPDTASADDVYTVAKQVKTSA